MDSSFFTFAPSVPFAFSFIFPLPLQIGREEGEGGRASERGVLPAFSSHALSCKLSRGKTELFRKGSFLHDF